MLTSKLQAAQKAIQQRYYPGFTWVVNESAPWAQLGRPLSQATVALLSTCGLYRVDTHLPFDAWNDLGDASFREIHVDVPRERLAIAHSHFNHEQLAADINVALPIEHFQRLAEGGTIGQLYPWTYSFMGYLPEPRQLLKESAAIVARRLKAGGVDAAFLTPC